MTISQYISRKKKDLYAKTLELETRIGEKNNTKILMLLDGAVFGYCLGRITYNFCHNPMTEADWFYAAAITLTSIGAVLLNDNYNARLASMNLEQEIRKLGLNPRYPCFKEE